MLRHECLKAQHHPPVARLCVNPCAVHQMDLMLTAYAKVGIHDVFNVNDIARQPIQRNRDEHCARALYVFKARMQTGPIHIKTRAVILIDGYQVMKNAQYAIMRSFCASRLMPSRFCSSVLTRMYPIALGADSGTTVSYRK